MKRYYSRVDRWVAIMLWAPILICWGICIPILSGMTTGNFWVVMITLIVSTALIISIFFNTYYTLDNQYLYWRTGPFNGKIELASITSIKKAKSAREIASMVKPILSTTPLIIRYNKYDDIPVSPGDEKEFLEKIQRHNPEIEILSD